MIMQCHIVIKCNCMAFHCTDPHLIELCPNEIQFHAYFIKPVSNLFQHLSVYTNIHVQFAKIHFRYGFLNFANSHD